MTSIPFEKNSIMLAPMAGITDSAFRTVCKKYGADVVFSEMVSSKGICFNDKKSTELLNHDEAEQPICLQIFGNDCECMKKATLFVSEKYSPLSIDINMGCPAPKIYSNGDGCALMKDIDRAYNIIKSVKENTDFPVSVKFRSGIDNNNINAVEFAKMCESAKADFITIHGRTREQFYSGNADYEIIKSVVESVNIPVIANGDIIDGQTAEYVLNHTGAHSVMVGRGSLGNPFVFTGIKKYLYSKEYVDIGKKELFDIALEQLCIAIDKKSEFTAVKEFRKHIMWYIKGVKNASKLKKMCCYVNTYSDCKEIFAKALSDNI